MDSKLDSVHDEERLLVIRQDGPSPTCCIAAAALQTALVETEQTTNWSFVCNEQAMIRIAMAQKEAEQLKMDAPRDLYEEATLAKECTKDLGSELQAMMMMDNNNSLDGDVTCTAKLLLVLNKKNMHMEHGATTKLAESYMKMAKAAKKESEFFFMEQAFAIIQYKETFIKVSVKPWNMVV